MARARLDKDYYAILGVSRAATEDEIRRAYRRQALEWHPDRRPGDAQAAERFREVSEAYAVLVNPARRREYDDLARDPVRWPRGRRWRCVRHLAAHLGAAFVPHRSCDAPGRPRRRAGTRR